MKQIASNYSYSPATNVVTLAGVNIDADQLLLIVAPQVGRTMYNFASVTGSVAAGSDTRVTLNASTAGLTTTSPLVIFYDDQASAQSVTGTVALDPASLIALENITVTIGNSVSCSNLGLVPSTAATDGVSDTTLNFIKIGGHQSGSNQTAHIVHVSAGGAMSVDASGSSVTFGQTTVTGQVELGPTSLNALESITVTMGQVTVTGGLTNTELRASAVTIGGTVTVGNSITIGSLPDIAIGISPVYDSGDDSLNVNIKNIGGGASLSPSNTFPISGTVTVGNSVTIGSFATSVTARLINPAGTAVTYAEVGTAGNPSIDVLSVQGVSGGTAVPISISSVTIGAVPSGTLTTRFGSCTTANTAQISSAVTNTGRKYLLIQNVTTSSNVITIGVGFTPTTTQGIQLSAGAGITFESSYIPTGAVYILSSVTASPFTILEA